MAQDSHVSIQAAAQVLGEVRRSGGDPAAVLADAGIDPALLADREARIDVATYHRVWELASARQDDGFAFRVASSFQLDTYGVLGYVALTSPTVGEAAERFIRYFRIWIGGVEWPLERVGDQVCLTYDPGRRSGPGYRRLCEVALAQWLHNLRAMTGRDLRPDEVRFVHPAPPDPSFEEAFFRAPIRHRSSSVALVFPADWLDIALPMGHPGLSGYFEQQAAELMARFPDRERMSHRVRDLLSTELRGGSPTVDVVARKLAVSTRTLHRRLREEETSYQAILDQMRGDLARRYLRNPRMGVGEVAFLLGFSEVSAFHRAFKRWTGSTPGEFRNPARPPGPPGART